MPFSILSARAAVLACLALAACGDGGNGGDPGPVKHYLVVLPVASSRGAGVVTGPGGIHCTYAGTVTSGTCSMTIPEGIAVPLTATPTGEALFDTWGGDCTGRGDCTAVMSDDRAVTARFMNAFTVTIVPAAGETGSGTVTSNPAGIACVLMAGVSTGTCAATFPDETSIIIAAAPAAGSLFLGWNASQCVPLEMQCVVPLDSSHTVAAAFGPQP